MDGRKGQAVLRSLKIPPCQGTLKIGIIITAVDIFAHSYGPRIDGPGVPRGGVEEELYIERPYGYRGLEHNLT